MSKITAVVLVATLIAGGSPAAASDQSWRKYADYVAVGIPLAAGGITLYESDRNGAVMLFESEAVGLGSAEALKFAIPEKRPNGGNHSFPSGHTAAAFASAGYLHARYGWQVGLPFELLAATVGFARVKSHDHHWYDVVAGAAIGEGSAFLLTRRLNENMRITTYGDTGGGGVGFAMKF